MGAPPGGDDASNQDGTDADMNSIGKGKGKGGFGNGMFGKGFKGKGKGSWKGGAWTKGAGKYGKAQEMPRGNQFLPVNAVSAERRDIPQNVVLRVEEDSRDPVIHVVFGDTRERTVRKAKEREALGLWSKGRRRAREDCS